jgi:hypothetical protein
MFSALCEPGAKDSTLVSILNPWFCGLRSPKFCKSGKKKRKEREKKWKKRKRKRKRKRRKEKQKEEKKNKNKKKKKNIYYKNKNTFSP